MEVPPSGGSLEIGNFLLDLGLVQSPKRSPFGGIPRNWKHRYRFGPRRVEFLVPPSGGSLEIGNRLQWRINKRLLPVPPSGGSLEIGNSPAVA